MTPSNKWKIKALILFQALNWEKTIPQSVTKDLKSSIITLKCPVACLWKCSTSRNGNVTAQNAVRTDKKKNILETIFAQKKIIIKLALRPVTL